MNESKMKLFLVSDKPKEQFNSSRDDHIIILAKTEENALKLAKEENPALCLRGSIAVLEDEKHERILVSVKYNKHYNPLIGATALLKHA